jgi:hypothetical protein
MKIKNKITPQQFRTFLLWFIAVLLIYGACHKLGIRFADAVEAPGDRHTFLPQNPDKVLTVRDKIIIEAFRAGIDPTEAVSIAQCESRENPNAKNWEGSTARGLYQFIFKTWDNNCKGDVYDADSNIACFIKFYPKHCGWWECAKILGYCD